MNHRSFNQFFCFLFTMVQVAFAQAETLEYSFGAASQSKNGFDFESVERIASPRNGNKAGWKVTHVGEQDPLPTVGGKTRFGLRGDFNIELAFRVETLEVPESGIGSGIMLRLEFADRDQSGLTVALNASPNELLFWQIDATRFGQQEHQVERKPAFTNIFELPQSIRMTRVGDEITVSVGSKETSMSFQTPSPTEVDVSTVAMWLGTGGGPADLAIGLDSIRIEAGKFANDIAAPPATSSWTILLWSSLATLAAVGAFWFRQTLRR
jgi:hypothetical protein